MLYEHYLGEVRIFASSDVPRGWVRCDGQTLNIAQHQQLFKLLGTSYGGDGVTTFRLPDLRGRTPIGMDGTGVGFKGGSETVVLKESQMPPHRHHIMCDITADRSINTGAPSAKSVPSSVVRGTPVGGPQQLKFHLSALTAAQNGFPLAVLEEGAMSMEGQGAPHENRQPYMTMFYCISLTGLYASKHKDKR